MRDELTLMELVDRYLSGELNASERAAFEERIRTNAELRELVADQRALHGGLHRLALRPSVNKAYRSYKWGKWLPGIGGAVVIAILAVGGWMLAKESGWMSDSAATTAESEQHDLIVLPDTAGTGLPALVMMIDPKADTTLITPNGLVLDIPKGAFVDGDGRTITTPVRVTMQEAINGLDIMKAGLSTMAGDTLLETGGMFYLDAQVNGERVGIDPNKPLTVMVPSDNADQRMMLYEGVMTEEGAVDWRNPQPLPRTLVPVDITTLDFYPPGYLDKLAELGKDARDKGYADSLYFSMTCRINGPQSDSAEAINIEPLQFYGHGAMLSMPRAIENDRLIAQARSTPSPCGVDPTKIKAIWNARFNNTNLATKQFEERLRIIHRSCDNEYLDAYVNNLDMNLSDIDAKIDNRLLRAFAKRSDGRVQLPKHAADRLRKIYEHWSRVESEAMRKTQAAFWTDQAEQDRNASQRMLAIDSEERRKDQARFQREFDMNLTDACRQLGIQKNGPIPEPPITAYVANITNPGWWNVDRAVFQSTADRKSMYFTDDKTGKTATLTYTPFTVEVADKESFEALRVYLIPKELNSYQRVVEKDGTFTESLNSLFEYDLVCMGRKNGQQFAASLPRISGRSNVSISMQPANDEELQRMVLTPQVTMSLVNDLVEQARHLEWLEREAKRQKANQARYELRNALMPVVFPCWREGDGAPAEDQTEYRAN